MKNSYGLVLILLTILISSTNTWARSSFIDISLSNKVKNYKVARAHWLPDYQSNMQSSSANGSGEDTESCEDMNYKSSEPPKYTCTEFNPGFTFTCYKDCECSSQYYHTTCANGEKLNNDCCEGKCSGCDTCTATSGWNYAKPCSDNNRLRTTKQECGDAYYCCNEGYKPTKDSILGSNGNIRLESCRADQKLLLTGGGTACAKCVAKTCTDYNKDYLTNSIAEKDCTKTTDTNGLTCYSCKDCDAQYQYNANNCLAPRSLGGQTCGNKHNQCNCPVAASCTNGCATYHAAPCNNICKTCTAEIICPINQYKLPHNYESNGICYGSIKTWIDAGKLTSN